MVHARPSAVAVATVAALALTGLHGVALSQSLLERPPNLSGGWVGTRGTLQFNFVHRFGISDAPLRKVTNSPTFLLAYQLPVPLLVGVNFATSSDVAPAFPNEWEAFARYARSGVALQLGYNQAARSADAELTGSRTMGALRVMAVGRVLSKGYASDTTRYAVGGGATLRLHRWIALAGDVATLLDRRSNEQVAWGAGLQIAIPYSPHTFSLQVTNTNTATLQGASRGIDRVRGGFEFTIPFTLNRYFGGRPSGGTASGTKVEMRELAFRPGRLEASVGATVEWTNRDQVVHTVTGDDGSWDSGPIEPGTTWRHTFERVGEYSFHCTPHPFMKGVVVVR
ncbi:MAG TPA: cupredoxin family copper-binding protein [Gemmatimonadales bacterium]|nr:cupredoxin family copper-binding protein [Gemmatimonadales bacterium]